MEIGFFTPEDRPFGHTYGQWTAKWWQWLLQIPRDKNPALDETGKNIELNQTNESVSFLTGTFVNTIKPPHRKISLPAKKPILIPVINYQANFIEDPIFKDESELEKHVVGDIDDIVLHEVLVDGKRLDDGVFRVESEPTLFPVDIADDLPHGVNGVDTGSIAGIGGVTQAIADGYWAFLKSLPPGEHKIDLFGSCTGGSRKTEAHYYLNLT
jgi:hypothetical protein